MFETLKSKLVREGRGWWKLWSNQFALLAGAIAAWAVDNRADVMSFIDTVGQPWRSLLTFTAVAVVPIWLRMSRQPKLQSPPEQD